MFTGIVETTGKIIEIRKEGSNIHFTVESSISSALKIDQSVSHDGICLTVVQVSGNRHIVTAVEETLKRSNFNHKKEGEELNLERSMMMNGRLDGHIVQGHVDEVAVCNKVEDKDGSWILTFKIQKVKNHLLVEKGSVSVNGVSLTVTKLSKKKFSVAIIPYTFEQTTFKNLKAGDQVNIEYDVIGKYVERMLESRKFLVGSS